jgi:hypothetical protein
MVVVGFGRKKRTARALEDATRRDPGVPGVLAVRLSGKIDHDQADGEVA